MNDSWCGISDFGEAKGMDGQTPFHRTGWSDVKNFLLYLGKFEKVQSDEGAQAQALIKYLCGLGSFVLF